MSEFPYCGAPIENLAHLVKERTRNTAPIQLVPDDPAYEPDFEDMQRRVPLLEKRERLTGFRPKTMLPETVDRVVAYFERKKGPFEFRGAVEIKPKPKHDTPSVGTTGYGTT